jgi:hypothetical protein
MAALDLSDYDGLIAALPSYLNRRDLTDQIPAFVLQAEAKLNRELRVRDMMTREDLTLDDTGFLDVPDDYLASDSLENVTGIGTYGADFAFVSEDEARLIRRGSSTPPQPTWYTIYGSEFEVFGGAEDQVVRLRYYQSIPALVTNSTNWLLTKSPDLYVAASCLEAALYLKDDNALTTRWAPVRQQIIDAMHLESDRSRFPQGKLLTTRRTFG